MYIPEVATHIISFGDSQDIINYTKHDSTPKTHTQAKIRIIMHRTALEIRRLEFKYQFHHKHCILGQVSVFSGPLFPHL